MTKNLFTKKRDPGRVLDFTFTKKYMYLFYKLSEKKDNDDDKIIEELKNIVGNKRFDQVLRCATVFLVEVLMSADFQVPGFDLSKLDKDLSKVDEPNEKE
jgi:hypothetical protein